MNRRRLFIFAGEHSGDMHGGHLLHKLRDVLPDLLVEGVGGPAMRNEGLDCVLRMEDFEVMGFTDVLKNFPKLWRQFYKIRDHLLISKPDAILLIDYPGFNLRLARALRKKGYKGRMIHYIAPTVWAHGKERIQWMADNFDSLLTIFPFEAKYFAHTNLKVDYVGNPLQEYKKNYRYEERWTKEVGIGTTEHLISLFPGSRKGEILRNLPAMLQAAESLQGDHPEITFAISCTNAEIKTIIQAQVLLCSLKNVHLVPKAYAYEMMRDSRLAIAKSGTITLELALHECPTVVVYKVTPLNWFFAKVCLRLKLPFYCIVNILKGECIFPELIEKGFSKENIYQQAKLLHTSEQHRQACIMGCREINNLLKEDNASALVAQKIQEILQC